MTEQPGLAELLLKHASRLEGAAVVTRPGGGIELMLDGRPFAAGEDTRATFRLRPEVAAAALLTPDVTTSPRGTGWVAFSPAALDEFSRDRAVAWLESAWRLTDEDVARESNAPREVRRGD